MSNPKKGYGRHFGYKESLLGSDQMGHDLKAFGNTTSKYIFWDASADTFYVEGSQVFGGDIQLKDSKKLFFGTGNDVSINWDGTNLVVTADADDSLIEIGDSATTQKSFDLKWYGNEASGASYLYGDASENLLYTKDIDMQFKDGDFLVFGTGADKTGDVSFIWDGTNLITKAIADDTLWEIGDSAATQLSFDIKWYANENNGASFVYFDASANLIYTTGVDLQFLDNDFVVFGTGAGASGDVQICWDGTNLLISASADDSLIEIGDSNATQKSFDIKLYGNESSGASYLYFDASANLLYTTDIDVQFKDNDICVFGTGAGASGDVQIVWDGTNLIMKAIADDTLIEIGDSAATQLSFDLKWYANENNGASFLYFDASANLIYTTGVDLQFLDNDICVFGTGAGASGDIQMYWDASDFVVKPTVSGSNIYFGGSANVLNKYHYGDSRLFNIENDATGCEIIAKKSRGAVSTALQDNDVLLLLQGQGFNDNATPSAKILANVKMLMTDSTDTTEDGAIVFETMVNGAAAAEKFRIADIATFSQDVNLGVDGTGYDFKAFGDTSGCYALWDQSEDQLVLSGPADVPVLKMIGDGSFSPAAFATAGTAWADGGTPAFAADQKYILIDFNGTIYRIPVWANA